MHYELCIMHCTIRCDGMLRGEDIVDTADGRRMRSRLHHVGIGLRLLGYLTHHGDEAVERLLRLVLRRFNHQRLVEQQGEIDRGGMVAVVQQTLGDVHRGDTRTFIL